MLGDIRAAALVAAGLLLNSAQVKGEELHPATIVPNSTYVAEVSSRLRMGWTEIAFRGNQPKAWDGTVSPEVRASLRVMAGLFEGKLEIGGVEDRFGRYEFADSNSLKAELQFGLNTGDWSYLVEWKGRNVFAADDNDFLAGLNSYGVRVKHRFSSEFFSGLSAGLFQLSFGAGYGAAIPSLFQREYADCELEMVQVFGDGFALTVAPKVEFADFVDFAGTDRTDAVFSLRIVPSYNFGSGVTVSVEGQATVGLSTLESKSGESWAITPILRLVRAL
jgi:hypothetical protein